MRQVLLVVVLNALVKPVYLLGIERAVQNKVGTETYGVFFVLFNFIYLFQVLNDLGIYSYNNRFIAQNRHLIDKYFPKLLNLKILLTGVFILVATGFGYYFGYVQTYPYLFLILLVNHALTAFFLYLRSNISGLGRYSHDSILSALDKLILIFLCMGLFYFTGEGFTIYHFALAQTTSLFLASGWAVWLLRKRIKIDVKQLNRTETTALLKQVVPFGFIILLGTIYARIDAVMLETLREDGIYQSGLYAAAYRLLNAFNMIGFLIGGLLFPMYSRAFRQMTPLQGIVRTGSAFLGWMSITVAVIFYFYGNAISNLMYTDSTVVWGSVLSLLMLTIIPKALDFMYGTMLIAAGKLRFLNTVFIITVIVNIGLNFWLIPLMGAYGAAITTLMSHTIVGTAFAWKCHHSILEKPFTKFWGRTILLGLILYGIGRGVQYAELDIYVGILGIGIVSVILVFTFGILRLKDLREIMSSSDTE